MKNKKPLIIDDKIITIFEEIEPREMIRVQQILQTLFEENIFDVKNGKVTLHFDSDKILREIEFNYKKRF